MTRRLAIEIGGTKLQAAVGDPQGQIGPVRRAAVAPGSTAADILAAVRDLAGPLARSGGIERVGIGFGGPVDTQAGRVVRSFHVAGWDGFALGAWAQDAFGLPAAIENDTNCGALAEARVGTGAGAPTVFYTNIGSGIGGGIVIDGQLYSRRFGAAEIGHTKLWDPAAGAYCIVEHLCSGWSINRMARQRAAAGKMAAALALAGGDVEALSAEHIGRAAADGDADALELVRAAAANFAVALCNVISLLNPDRIVVGGGVSLMGEVFFAPLRAAVADGVFAPYADNYRILPAALGENVVLVGALMIP